MMHTRLSTVHRLWYAVYICFLICLYLGLKAMTSQHLLESTNHRPMLDQNMINGISNSGEFQRGWIHDGVFETNKGLHTLKRTERLFHRNVTLFGKSIQGTPYPPTFVNGTDINPQIIDVFQLKAEEPKDLYVNLHSYSFTLNSRVCSQGKVFLVVVIHSAPKHSSRRHLIRTTFGSVALYREKNIETVFMVGRVRRKSVQEILEEESERFGDIVQGNFIDRYKNLTLKHIMAMHWFKYNCNAKYILKLDDDTFVNPFRVVDYILKVKPQGRGLWCKILKDQGPVRIGGSKWFTSRKQYPFSILPPFCIGFAYITTSETWKEMYTASETSRPMTMDDLYVSVVLALKAKVRKFDFSKILIQCPENRTFDIEDLNRKAIVLDRGGHCGDVPFKQWRHIQIPEE